jgi:predicted aspartyl protease
MKIPLHLTFDDDSKETAEVYVDGKINGVETRFLLDTGCALTTINHDDFSSSFTTTEQQNSSGAFGETTHDLITVDSITLDRLKKTNHRICRGAKGKLDRKLLGMDMLKEYAINFSFNNQSMEFTQPSSRKMNTETLILDSGQIPHITVRCNNKEVIAVWDTGASITLVNFSFIQNNQEMFEAIGEEAGTDSTGQTMVTPIFLMKKLEIAGRIFKPHKVVALDISHIQKVAQLPMEMILGYSTLRQADWHMNFPRQEWKLL